MQIETRPYLARRIWAPGIKVNNVVDARAAAVNDPVVAVKGGRVAEDGVEAGSGGHAIVFVGEGFEFGGFAAENVNVRWTLIRTEKKERGV